ncbi:hypothetical protein AMK28_24750 [Streptomyces sp. CB02115]|nr:hypothetical protein AMK28_24750 [Streptomyces sp. CB02115]
MSAFSEAELTHQVGTEFLGDACRFLVVCDGWEQRVYWLNVVRAAGIGVCDLAATSEVRSAGFEGPRAV